jgi:hypothetical protein
VSTNYHDEARAAFGPSARIANAGRYAAVSRCASKPLVYLFTCAASRAAKLLEWERCNCPAGGDCANAHFPKDFAETVRPVPLHRSMEGVGDWHK